MSVRDFPDHIPQRILHDTDHSLRETTLAGHRFIVTWREAHCFIIMSSASDCFVDLGEFGKVITVVQNETVDRFDTKVGDAPHSLEDRFSSCLSSRSAVIVFKPRQGF